MSSFYPLPKAIERRHKQHIKSKAQSYFAIIVPGLIHEASMEFSWLQIPHQIEEGGIQFEATLEELWKVHQLCRIPSRILLRIMQFRAIRFEKLRDICKKIPWELYLRPDVALQIKASCSDSQLWHQEAVADTTFQAIKIRMREAYPDYDFNQKTSHEQTVFVRMHKEVAHISLDASGSPLYLRGYDKWIAEAPIRDNLAAAMLMASGVGTWDKIVDPCGGSGTLILESFLRFEGPLPGQTRSFAYENWVGFSPNAYQFLLKKLSTERAAPQPCSFEIRDRAAKCLGIAQRNLAQLNIPAEFKMADLLNDPGSPLGLFEAGLLISNLPYGDRLKIPGKDLEFFARIGKALRSHWQGWNYALIIPQGKAEMALDLPFDRKLFFSNGGIDVTCMIGKIPKKG